MISNIEQTFQGAALGAIETHWRPNIEWKEKRKPSQWAVEERRIAPGQSPLSSGREIAYSHSVMPHCVEQMDSADDPNIRTIVIWAAIRDGKTNGTCLNIFGRTVTDDPGNVYSVHPIKDDVAKFSNDDIEPMIEACLSGYFVEKKSRDSGRTIDYKKFLAGSLRIVSAGSVTKFRGTSVKVLFLHELDALNPESIHKAFGRTTGFADAIIVEESTGTLAPTFDKDGNILYNSNIHEAYDRGDKRKWFGPCRKCDGLQWLKYDHFWWPDRKMHKAVYLCEYCEADHNEKQWRDFQHAARWFPTAGVSEEQQKNIAQHAHRAKAIDPTVRSYWRNGFNRLLPVAKGYKSTLHEIVAKGEAAKTDKAKLKIWKQEEAAELWDASAEGEPPPPWKPIFERREDYGGKDRPFVVPAGGLFLTAFVDCQLNRLEVGWRAFGRNDESWGMDYVVLDGAVREPEVWQKLRIELARKWKHESGGMILLGMAFVDGGHYAEDVYRFFQTLSRNPVPGVNGHCRASKGIGQYGYPIVNPKMMTVAKTLKGHHIGTWEAKDRIYERLRMANPETETSDSGNNQSSENRSIREARSKDRSIANSEVEEIREGVMHYNLRYPEQYFQGLTVETVTVTFEKGLEIRKYVNPKQQRNEPLDIEVGCLAAYKLRPKNWEALETEIKATVPAAGKPTAAPTGRPRKRSNWLDWQR